MRIAVACDGLAIAAHFVQCTSYMCYTVEQGVVVDSRNVPTLDRPLEKLPEFFRVIEADVLLTGAIEDSLVTILESTGMKVVSGAEGDPLTAVRAYLARSRFVQ